MNISVKASAEGNAGVPGVPRSSILAHVIRDDEEAITIAEALAEDFSKEASQRDLERRWPVAELDQFSQSGMWSINVPKAFGGPDLSYVTLCKVIEISPRSIHRSARSRKTISASSRRSAPCRTRHSSGCSLPRS